MAYNLKPFTEILSVEHFLLLYFGERCRFCERSYLCTGGEDTILRIHELSTSDERPTLIPAIVARGHVSSIKSLAVVRRQEEVFLISGGGRAQLMAWQLRTVDGQVMCSRLADFMLRGSDRAVRKPWRKAQSVVRHDPETRFITLDTCQVDGTTLVLVGSSDSILRVFEFTAKHTLELIDELDFQLNCILQVKVFELGGVPHLACGTTGGRVSVWNLPNMQNFTEFSIHQVRLSSSGKIF